MRTVVEKYITEKRLFEPGDRVVVGVSGGADSVALVYVLHFLQARLGIMLHLAHLNHGIRGAEADDDQRSVELLAASLKLPLSTARSDVPGIAGRSGVSIEMAARAERLAFFRETVASAHADSVALAHNADDQAETVLMRLARGSGRSGLSGIAPRQEIESLVIVHPMLAVSHGEAVGFLERHGLGWREDASNTNLDYTRNRVRHQLLPLIAEKLNPNIRSSLCRTAEILGEEDRLLDSAAQAVLAEARVADGAEIDLDRLRRHPKPLRRRALLSWLYAGGLPAESVDFAVIDAIERISADLRGSKSIDIGGGWRVVRSYGRILLSADEGREGLSAPCSISVPGETLCPELGLLVRVERCKGIVRERCGRPGRVPSACSISAAELGTRPLVLRTWRPGDRLRPYGMSGSRKIQDILTDGKIPAAQRPCVPVIESDGEVVWLPGYRIADQWAVESAGAPSLRISVEPN